MNRYFIELAYKGTHFKGFQIQENGNTIQGEINKALHIILKQPIETTTSSRTDAGVHALQNFLHFDTDIVLSKSIIYSLNAIIHSDIVVKNIYLVSNTFHARFDANSRNYCYTIIQHKDPFLKETAYFFPFTIQVETLHETASILIGTHDFTSFSKRNTDVNNYICTIKNAYWKVNENNSISFYVEANRFLRGMVRALVTTQLQVARGKISVHDFKKIIELKDCTKADFSAEACGLFLEKVNYPITFQGI